MIKPNSFNSRPSTHSSKSRIPLDEVSNSNQEIKNLEHLNSARSSDFNSVKFQQARSSTDGQSTVLKRRSESKELFKMKSECDLAKLNEESLKNEINVREKCLN